MLALVGHSLELLGSVLVAMPLISMIGALRTVGKLSQMTSIPADLSRVVIAAQKRNASWPSKIELTSLAAGAIFNITGIAVLVVDTAISE